MNEYKQSKSAIIASYVCYRWFLALITCGILCLYDFLIYKNTKLKFGEKFLIFETGALTKKSKEIPHEDVMNVRAEQSFIGQIFKYGTVTVIMKNGADTIVFKYADKPDALRLHIQQMFIGSGKFKIS